MAHLSATNQAFAGRKSHPWRVRLYASCIRSLRASILCAWPSWPGSCLPKSDRASCPALNLREAHAFALRSTDLAAFVVPPADRGGRLLIDLRISLRAGRASCPSWDNLPVLLLDGRPGPAPAFRSPTRLPAWFQIYSNFISSYEDFFPGEPIPLGEIRGDQRITCVARSGGRSVAKPDTRRNGCCRTPDTSFPGSEWNRSRAETPNTSSRRDAEKFSAPLRETIRDHSVPCHSIRR